MLVCAVSASIRHRSVLTPQTRLYSKGRIMGHQRGKRNSHPGTTLVRIEGVESTKDAQFYLGKVRIAGQRRGQDLTLTMQRIAYVYRAPTEVRGSKIRVIWGRVTRTHGNSGVVRSKFRHNIPSQAFGAPVRVLLYPSNSACQWLDGADLQSNCLNASSNVLRSHASCALDVHLSYCHSLMN